MASPFVKVEKPGEFGYDNQFQARFLSIHEFGHSFVNKRRFISIKTDFKNSKISLKSQN
jgi:hypothetical protein